MERAMQDMDYATAFGLDETDKGCVVYRNYEAIEKGHLIDREHPDVHSLFQQFR
jgi:hypothetical protein